MEAPIDRSCLFSFDDLHIAATGRAMNEAENAALRAMSQPQKNQLARRLVEQTSGSFACEDRVGTDGVIYTAFWAVDA